MSSRSGVCKTGNSKCLLVSFCVMVMMAMARGIVGGNYGEALTKSLLYFEAQRSGELPANQRVQWRSHSALSDGADSHIDLTGGYYDAGDNMKFGFPLAFTTTMLAWSCVDMRSQLRSHKELHNAMTALKWATDYLIKAHPEPNVLYAQVGEGDSDHSCWQRPEDMTTPRPSFRIDDQHPGSDLAAETAAAMAAASIAFRPYKSSAAYSDRLVGHAKQLFEFARTHPGLYQNAVPSAAKFYSSSGFEDEMLWAAAWLYRATGDKTFFDYLTESSNTGGARSTFSWDDKFLGAQVLAAKLVLGKKTKNEGKLGEYKSLAEQFLCRCAQKGGNNIEKTAGGMLWFLPWNNLQYTATASFVSSVYAQYLKAANSSIHCPGGVLRPSDLLALSRSQVDYILGSNPKNMSYMVGFGARYPVHVHHRGASIVSIKKDSTPVSCKGGFDAWFNNPNPNPNVLVGAVVGGPDMTDNYNDDRSNFQQSEPAPVTVAPLVGVLASIA